MKKINNFFRFVFVYKALNEYQAHATRWQIFKFHIRNGFRRVTIFATFALTAYLSGFLYNKFNPLTVYAEKIVKVEVPIVKNIPVLARIAKCESGNSQYDKNGQVTVNANQNGSVDIGKYQINLKVWGSKAKELNLDLSKDSDNETMANWIFENRGTEDWYSSVNCWSK